MSVAEKVKQEIIQPKKNNNGLLVGNPVYKPFRYPWCYDPWLTQQRIHWLPEEVPLGDDVSFCFYGNCSYCSLLTFVRYNWNA